MPEEYDEVMTVEEVAEFLRLKKGTVYRHTQDGKIPAFKVGSSWRYKRSSIAKWIEGSLNKQEVN